MGARGKPADRIESRVRVGSYLRLYAARERRQSRRPNQLAFSLQREHNSQDYSYYMVL